MQKNRPIRTNINASSHDLSHSEMGFYQSVPQYETFVENCAFNIPMTKSAQSDTEKFDTSLPLKTTEADVSSLAKSIQNSPQFKPWIGSAILLMDLDAFFASVEQLDHPEWRGKPVIVGGSPEKRGVVSTASYEARKFGVHSAMPSSTAARLCPQAIWTPGNFHRYREMSKKVMDILYEESPQLMQVSIDEAFLDVSPTRTNRTHPIEVAKRIQMRVSQLGITCSIGLGASKSVAKIASNQNKPRGLTVVYPEDSQAFLAPLPVKEMSGIGPVAVKKLNSYHIHTLGDLVNADPVLLREVFGKNTALMVDRARGIDTAVNSEHEPTKSISNEISFAQSLSDREELRARIATMAHKVGRRLRRKHLEGTTLHLKIRREDLTIRTCQRKLPDLGTNELLWLPQLYEMLDELWTPGEKLRLVGVGVSGFDGEPVQTTLFGGLDDDEVLAKASLLAAGSKKGSQYKRIDNADVADPQTPHNKHHSVKRSALISQAKKNSKLLEANDLIAQRFGEGAVRFGHEMRTYSDTTGSSAKNPEDYKD